MGILIQLFFEFFKVGLFSVGGGLATLPFLYALSNASHWFSHTDIANMIAIAESTPGAIGVNMATYAGYLTAHIPGGIIATLGLITPSVVIIIIVAKMLEKFKGNKYVDAAFFGLRPASMALISVAGINVAKTALLNVEAFSISKNLFSTISFQALILAVILYIAQSKTKVHPIVWIILSAIVGIIFKF